MSRVYIVFLILLIPIVPKIWSSPFAMEIFSRTRWFTISLKVFRESLFCFTEKICSSILILFSLFDDILISNSFIIRFPVYLPIPILDMSNMYHPSSKIYCFHDILVRIIKMLRLPRFWYPYDLNGLVKLIDTDRHRADRHRNRRIRTFQMHSWIIWNLVIWKLAAFIHNDPYYHV